MVDVGIGRLLIASLHQGIADTSPTRLDFYENWLGPTGLNNSRMGVAPLGAVLSFIHQEPPPLNERMATRAGECAAEWAFASMSPFRLRLTRRLPTAWRARAACRLGRRLVAETVRPSKTTWRMDATGGDVDIESALFGQLRESSLDPMRVFYAAAIERCLTLCGVGGVVRVAASDAVSCRLAVQLQQPQAAPALSPGSSLPGHAG